MTRLSLIVPMYQLGKYLAPMLQTVADQTAEFELWLVDDGSSDDTLAQAQRFVAGIPNWHAEALPHHSGIGAARNFGLEQATGDIVAFVDGDDRLAADYVETMYTGFTMQPQVAAVTVGYQWWGGGAPRHGRWQQLDQRTMFEQVSHHGTQVGGYVWNKAFARTAIGTLRFDEQLAIAEDYWFTASFVAANAGSYWFEPTLRYTKVTRPNSTIHSATWGMRAQEDEVFAKISRLGEHLNNGHDHDRHH